MLFRSRKKPNGDILFIRSQHPYSKLFFVGRGKSNHKFLSLWKCSDREQSYSSRLYSIITLAYQKNLTDHDIISLCCCWYVLRQPHPDKLCQDKISQFRAILNTVKDNPEANEIKADLIARRRESNRVAQQTARNKKKAAKEAKESNEQPK